jgi:hemin uptake protein HemP
MSLTNAPANTAVQPSPDHTANTASPEISSMRLLGDQGLLRIEHKGALYTLRATSKGGLILTK